MKKPTLTILALLALTLTGCEKETKEQKQQRIDDIYGSCLKTVNYKGHSYILYDGNRKGGITHDPDCQCREKGGGHD